MMLFDSNVKYISVRVSLILVKFIVHFYTILGTFLLRVHSYTNLGTFLCRVHSYTILGNISICLKCGFHKKSFILNATLVSCPFPSSLLGGCNSKLYDTQLFSGCPPEKNLGRFYRVLFKSILRVQFKQANVLTSSKQV